MKNLLFIVFVMCANTQLFAQVKIYTANTASSFVNKPAAEAYTGSAYATNAPEKSSFDKTAQLSSKIVTDYKYIRLSYQIPALTALEWAIIRRKASSILDEDFEYLKKNKPEVFNSLMSLANNDFIPLSTYAPLNVKLEFRYNTTEIYKTDKYASVLNVPSLRSIILSIKK